MSRLTRDGTAEPVSRDQILRHARGQGDIYFPCSADHEQDWQPWGRFRPLKKFEKFAIFSKLSKLSNFPRSTMWKLTSTSRSVLVHFHIVESGKLESLKNTPLLLLQPWYTVLSRLQQGKTRIGQLNLCRMNSLSPAAIRAGFSSPPRPQIGIAHGIRSVTLGHD